MKTELENYLEAKKALDDATLGFNIEENENIVANSNEYQLIFWFAQDVKSANKEKLFKSILKSGRLDWINYYLKYIKFNKDQFSDYLLFI